MVCEESGEIGNSGTIAKQGTFVTNLNALQPADIDGDHIHGNAANDIAQLTIDQDLPGGIDLCTWITVSITGSNYRHRHIPFTGIGIGITDDIAAMRI